MMNMDTILEWRRDLIYAFPFLLSSIACLKHISNLVKNSKHIKNDVAHASRNSLFSFVLNSMRNNQTTEKVQQILESKKYLLSITQLVKAYTLNKRSKVWIPRAPWFEPFDRNLDQIKLSQSPRVRIKSLKSPKI